jgi:energy-coupling factor transport system permease protein
MLLLPASPSALQRANPAAKLLGLAVVAAGATLTYEPFIPAALLAGLWLAAFAVGRIPLRRMLRASAVLLLVPLPLVFFTALYADVDSASAHVLARFGPWVMTEEGLRMGAGLGLRVAAFLAGSLLYVSTTDPTDFALSLIQNLGLPYRFGYGLLVSYRFLPSLREEYETIRMAHRVRGVGRRAGLRGRWEEVSRMAVPLLAAAIRRSERTALAMDARGFASGPDRTFYRRLPLRASDLIYVAASAAFVLTVYAVALRWDLARLEWIPGA